MEKEAFIIGTGPSLKKIDMTKLKDKITITFNRAYVAFDDWGFDPTYYLAIDSNDIRSVYKDINNLVLNSNIKKFFLIKTNDNQLHTTTDFQDGDIVSNENMYVKSNKIRLIHPTNYSYDYPLLCDTIESENMINTSLPPNAGFLGLKMLYHEGYRKIYLLGMDARYSDDIEYRNVERKGGQYTADSDNDVNHFRSDYFGKNITFGKPNQSEIIRIWSKFINEVLPKKYPDLEIISCSENSNLNDFIKYENFDAIIK